MITAKEVAENASKGTQGPWCRGGHGKIATTIVYAGSSIGSPICRAHLPKEINRHFSESRANARRIASVPDMEALIAEQAARIESLTRECDDLKDFCKGVARNITLMLKDPE